MHIADINLLNNASIISVYDQFDFRLNAYISKGMNFSLKCMSINTNIYTNSPTHFQSNSLMQYVYYHKIQL